VAVELERPAVLTITGGRLAIASGAPDDSALEPLSHWLLPAGRWQLQGRGTALLASGAPSGPQQD